MPGITGAAAASWRAAMHGVASGTTGPPADAPWPEPNGGPGAQDRVYSD
ncbi:MAG TPA: hypothetical protein VMB50_25100 [Myxococcales bacterium]|nr:hypothetical protein [Myxococcales bacterium]